MPFSQGVEDRLRNHQAYRYVPSPGCGTIAQIPETVPVYNLPPGPNDWPHNRSKPPRRSRDYLDPALREAILGSVRALLIRYGTNYNSTHRVRDLAMALETDISTDYPSLRKTLRAIYLQPDYVQEGEVEKTLYKGLYQLLEDKEASYIRHQQALEAQRNRAAGLDNGTARLEGFSSATLSRDEHDGDTGRTMPLGTPGLEGFSSATLGGDSNAERPRPMGVAGLEGFSSATLSTDGNRGGTRPSGTDAGMQRYHEIMRNFRIHVGLPEETTRRHETPSAPPENLTISNIRLPPPSYNIVASNIPPSAPELPTGEQGQPLVNSDVPCSPPPSYDQVMNWS